jgi:CRP-like cAMP-binding protein
MALIDRRPRSATAIAKTDAHLVRIDERRFQFMVQQTPFFALEVMRTIVRRLRDMNARL